MNDCFVYMAWPLYLEMIDWGGGVGQKKHRVAAQDKPQLIRVLVRFQTQLTSVVFYLCIFFNCNHISNLITHFRA